jgi:hypothetical protein
MTDDPIKVELEPAEAPETKIVEAVEKPKSAAKIIPAEAGMEELKKQVEGERQAAADRLAERDRLLRDAANRAQVAEREVVVTRKNAVDAALTGLAKDRETAKRDLIAAHEAGDFAKVADAHDRLAEAHARIAAAQQGQMALQEQVNNPPPPVYVDNVEKIARTLQPKSANWLRAHREYAEPGDANERMVRAHYSAIGEGLAPETDEYFAHVEKRLGIGVRQEQETEVEPDRRSNGGRAPTSAPVTRRVMGDNSRGGDAPGIVRLTGEERSVAMAMNTDPKRSEDEILRAYAKNKLALIAEGKIASRS